LTAAQTHPGCRRRPSEEMFATVCCTWISPDRARVTLALAGYPPPLLVRAGRVAVEELPGGPAAAPARPSHEQARTTLNRYTHVPADSHARVRAAHVARRNTDGTQPAETRKGTVSLPRCRRPQLGFLPRGRDRFRTRGLCRMKANRTSLWPGWAAA